MVDLPRLLRVERSRLADLLGALDAEDWTRPTLCIAWTVRETVAHLTAAASTRTPTWMLTMVRSRFDTDRHNDRLLRRHLGADPAATLDAFTATTSSTIAPFGALDATLVKGLQLRPTDLDLILGDGPAVRGTALDLVLAMAGRPQAVDGLEGEGAVVLGERLAAHA